MLTVLLRFSVAVVISVSCCSRWSCHNDIVKWKHCPRCSCIINVIATCRKNFSQWESSFLWKLRCHWLKFLRRVAKTLVIQGPGLLCGEFAGDRWPLNSHHKGQWHIVLMFSLICDWTNGGVNNRDHGDLRCHRVHYDVTVMINIFHGWFTLWLSHGKS